MVESLPQTHQINCILRCLSSAKRPKEGLCFEKNIHEVALMGSEPLTSAVLESNHSQNFFSAQEKISQNISQASTVT